MKRILTLIGAFVGVGLLGFLFGFVSQMGKTNAAANDAKLCRETADAQAKEAEATVGLLELYRARAEVGRANFGIAGDALGRAKERLSGEPHAELRKAIDETTAKVLKQEAASGDDIAAIIKTLEAKSKSP